MQLNGLVLIGGKSTRMGIDKSSIQYRDKIHRAYLADLLKEVGCEKVYLSCTNDQSQKIFFNYPIIPDKYQNVGPISGVLSAFEFCLDCAWFVVGCDYALLDIEVLQQLVSNRQLTSDASLFRHPDSGFLEPFITIYEPKSYSKIKIRFQNGEHSLRKILENLNINSLSLNTSHKLMNVNTPQEKQKALKQIREE